MRICFDLDGVICRLKTDDQTYGTVEVMPGAVEKLRALRRAGHEIVIATARHMATCGQNPGKVVARQGLTTLRWLEENGIEYDEIWFGKPHCDVYIDDNAFRFSSMDEISDDGSSLPMSTEKRMKLAKAQRQSS